MKRNLKLLKICCSLITRGCAGLIPLSISSRMCSLMAMKKILNVHPPVAEDPEVEAAPPEAPLVVVNLPLKQVKPRQLQAEVVAPRKQQTPSWKKILMSVSCRHSLKLKLMRRSAKSHPLRSNRKVTIREERRMRNRILKLSLSIMMKVKKRKRHKRDQCHVAQQENNQHHRINQHHKKPVHHKAKDLPRRERNSKKKMMRWMTWTRNSQK
jgi:hypothetical protein